MYLVVNIVVFLFIFSSFINGDTKSDNEKSKVIIDNDAGGDDAMAIFLTLLYEKYYDGPKLIGLTTANGNTNEDNVSTNNQRILRVANRSDIPIYRGAKSSLVVTPDAGAYYGEDGLGDTGECLEGLQPTHAQGAVEALIEQSKIHEGKLIVIAIGAVTNIALAIRLDPGFIDRLQHLYVGAGHVQSEKFPDAEFNAHMDAEAYSIVVKASKPDKVTVFPFSTTMTSLNFTKDWRMNVLGAVDTNVMRHQNLFERVPLADTEEWAALDPSVVAAVVRPDLVEEYKYSDNDIVLCGDKRATMSHKFVDKDESNVRLVHSMKTEEYKQFLLDVFSHDL